MRNFLHLLLFLSELRNGKTFVVAMANVFSVTGIPLGTWQFLGFIFIFLQNGDSPSG